MVLSLSCPLGQSYARQGGGGCAAEAAGATKTAGAADRLLELRDLDHIRGDDALKNELGDAVTFGHGEVGLSMVKEKDLHRAPVVGIDHPSARVDEVLGRQARAGGDAAV